MNTSADIIIRLLGGTNAAARFFSISPGAVPQWRHNGLPPARELELMRRAPGIYAAALQAAVEDKKA